MRVFVAGLLSIALLACCSLSCVEAVSNGLLGFCDLTPYTGWSNQFYPNGNIGYRSNTAVGPGDAYMAWADPPTPRSDYTIRTADTPLADRSKDPDFYVPGQLTAIHVRANNVSNRWLGLMLYATTEPKLMRQHMWEWVDGVKIGYISGSMQNHVGSWSVPVTSDYQVTPTCKATVTHTNAAIKPTHQKFYFQAPKGTGNVTFRILLKYGVQNDGAFFYPERTLMLREGPAPSAPAKTLCSAAAASSTAGAPVVNDPATAQCLNGSSFYAWAQSSSAGISAAVVGAPATSCAATCAANKRTLTPFCDAAALRDINSAAELRSLTNGVAACRTQVLAACKYVGPPRIDSAGYCSYPADNIERTCPPAVLTAIKNPADVAALPDANVCYTNAAASASPICICSSRSSVQEQNPFLAAAVKAKATSSSKSALTLSESTGAAVTQVSGLSWVAVGLAGGASMAAPLQRRSNLLLALLLVTLTMMSLVPVQAHNYMMSLQRATMASTFYPCIQRQGNQPHAQVKANQRFEMEWSNGHGGPDNNRPIQYFIIIPAAALEIVKQMRNMTEIINDYIASAPASADVSGYGDNYGGGDSGLPNGPLKKYQLGGQTNLRGRGQRIVNESYFTNSDLPLTDPARVVREFTYWNKFVATDGVKDRQIQQQPKGWFTRNDRRVSYQSEKYPWIESAHNFSMFYDQHAPGGSEWSSRAALAQFSIRGWHGPGDYIAWYMWHGYYDCMDINLLPGDVAEGDEPVQNRYGTIAAKPEPSVTKVHHCEYIGVTSVATQTYKLDPKTRDASRCIEECKVRNIKQAGQSDPGCLGVQVVRAKVAPMALAVNTRAVPNIPYTRSHHAGDAYEDCYRPTVQARWDAGCRVGRVNSQNTSALDPLCDESKLGPFSDDDLVCYGLVPDSKSGAQVAESWAVATQPEDPSWYSTCFFVQTNGNGGFIGIDPAPTSEVPAWDNSGEHCTPCEFQAQVAAQNFSQVPNWVAALAEQNDFVHGSQSSLGGGCVDCSLWSNSASATMVRSLLAGSNTLAVPSQGTEIGAYAPQQESAAGLSDNGDDTDGKLANSESSSGKKSALSTVALIGIIVGGVALLLVAGALIFCLRRQRAAANFDKNMQGMRSSGGDTQLTGNPALTDW